MRCCEVARVWEALVYATTSEAVLDQPHRRPHAPVSSVCNALCTAALSKQLKSATLAFPAACARADAALISAAAAAMLRLACRGLTELRVTNTSGDELASIPMPVVLAAQQFVSVTALELFSVALSEETSIELAAATTAMPLVAFKAELVTWVCGVGGTLEALNACDMLQSIDVFRCEEASQWVGVFSLPQLTVLRFELDEFSLLLVERVFTRDGSDACLACVTWPCTSACSPRVPVRLQPCFLRSRRSRAFTLAHRCTASPP